jgi:small subunit ribosomal protein S21
MNKKQKQHQTTVPGNPLAVKVVGTQREDLGFALKAFKRKIKSSGILESVKDRKEFEKISVRKRKQIQRAQFIQKIKDRNDF